MNQTLIIRGINFPRYQNGERQSFHLQIAEILRLAGIFDNEETRELFDLYCQKCEELVQAGKYVRSLLTTIDVTEASKEADLAFRHLYRELKTLKFHPSPDVLAAYSQLEITVLKQFPANTIKCRLDLRIQYYSIMASRLIKDWSELMNQVGFMSDIERLRKAIDSFNDAYNRRIEEKSAKEPGKTLRIFDELSELYRELMRYLDAWANNPSNRSPYCERAVKARETIMTCNELIGQFHKSMLIAASNRKRGKNKTR